jgi:hypothetical protein
LHRAGKRFSAESAVARDNETRTTPLHERADMRAERSSEGRSNHRSHGLSDNAAGT